MTLANIGFSESHLQVVPSRQPQSFTHYYFSASGTERDVFLKRCTQFRDAAGVSLEFDDDGDAVMTLPPESAETVHHLAAANGLRLFPLGDA